MADDAAADDDGLTPAERRARRRQRAASTAAERSVTFKGESSLEQVVGENEAAAEEEAMSGQGMDGLGILPQDVVTQPPAARSSRHVPPSITHADAQFQQDALTGKFKRVDLQRRADSPATAANSTRNALGSLSGGGIKLGSSGSSNEREAPQVGEGKPVEPTTEILFASAIYNIVVAPTRFAPGILAGIAVFESAALAQITPAAMTPLSAFIIYSSCALHIYRVLLWGGLVSFVGVYLRMMARGRSTHYRLQPWRQMLDVFLLFLYAGIVWLTFSSRQLAWTISSSHVKSALPFMVPGSRMENVFYQQILDMLADHANLLSGRDIICILGGALSLVPASDEYFARTPPYLLQALRAEARRRVAIQPSGADYTDAEPHVLRDGHGFVEGGITFLVAFWSVRGHMAQQKPPERAADGGPALRPLPWRIMDRSAYTWRVFGAMFMLLLDVGVNTFSDSVHWRTAFGDGETVADLIASIALFVIAVAIRVLFAICFFLLLVNTAHFRLGRYAELSRDFGGALVVTLLSFGLVVAMRALRIVRGAMSDAVRWHVTDFWTGEPFGIPYSAIWCAHLFLTALFYIKGVSALRRLAASEYHTHPDLFYQRQGGAAANMNRARPSVGRIGVGGGQYGTQMTPI